MATYIFREGFSNERGLPTIGIIAVLERLDIPYSIRYGEFPQHETSIRDGTWVVDMPSELSREQVGSINEYGYRVFLEL
jgi:hypothetical protein